jgi:SPX domain protein involved in polyphosphate accumulation
MQGLAEENIKESIELFSEIQKMIDAKQLKPMLRTQYMRTLFQVSVA